MAVVVIAVEVDLLLTVPLGGEGDDAPELLNLVESYVLLPQPPHVSEVGACLDVDGKDLDSQVTTFRL